MSDSNELAWIATRSMRGPAHGRYAARLSQVPSAALINLLAQACVELPDWRRRVDELMAQWSPLPAFATSEVLLSHDFLTTILGHLVRNVRPLRACVRRGEQRGMHRLANGAYSMGLMCSSLMGLI